MEKWSNCLVFTTGAESMQVQREVLRQWSLASSPPPPTAPAYVPLKTEVEGQESCCLKNPKKHCSVVAAESQERYMCACFR